MNRRLFLGTAGAATIGLLAGCVSELAPGSNDPDYETEEHAGQVVPLAPIDDVYEWYQADEAKFVDARTERHYQNAHIRGAVLSPVDQDDPDDPVLEWSTDERLVTYCDCPHSLAVQRAAELREDGYENVYAIDEGFLEWEDREYPMGGADVQQSVSTHLIEGRAGSEHAGEYVRLTDPENGLIDYERIDEDGRFHLEPRAVDVSEGAELSLETPGSTHHGTISELTSGVFEV